jgi:thioredoxin-related protein
MTRRLLALTAALFFCLAAAAPVRAEGLDFLDYGPGLAKAAEEKKFVMLFVWADWCPYCKLIRAQVFESGDVKKAFDPSFVAVSVNVEKDPDGLQRKYGAKVLPTLTFLNAAGEEVAYWEGAADPGTFLKILDYVKENPGKSPASQSGAKGETGNDS